MPETAGGQLAFELFLPLMSGPITAQQAHKPRRHSHADPLQGSLPRLIIFILG